MDQWKSVILVGYPMITYDASPPPTSPFQWWFKRRKVPEKSFPLLPFCILDWGFIHLRFKHSALGDKGAPTDWTTRYISHSKLYSLLHLKFESGSPITQLTYAHRGWTTLFDLNLLQRQSNHLGLNLEWFTSERISTAVEDMDSKNLHPQTSEAFFTASKNFCCCRNLS